MLNTQNIYLYLLFILSFCSLFDLKAQETTVINWNNLTPTTVDTLIEQGTYPENRLKASMASVFGFRNSMILFGGIDSTQNNLNDTWALSYISNSSTSPPTIQWTNLNPTNPPSIRNGAAMTSNLNLAEIILFGGQSNDGFLSDVWRFNFPSTWSQDSIQSSTNPTGRSQATIAFDYPNGRYILFGGETAEGLNQETWAYYSTTMKWVNLTPDPIPANYPVARSQAVMATDTLGTILLFGGNGGDEGLLNDLWSFNAETSTWESISPLDLSTYPSARYGATMTFDNALANTFLLFGGFDGETALNDTWSYDKTTNIWTELTLSTSPPVLEFATMVYDIASGQSFLFGGTSDGTTPLDDTWTLGNNVSQPIVVSSGDGSATFTPSNGPIILSSALESAPFLSIRAKKMHHQLINVIQLRAPRKGAVVTTFRFYKDKLLRSLIAEIPVSQPQFIQPVKKSCKANKYYILSVDSVGNTSAPLLVKIKSKRRHCK